MRTQRQQDWIDALKSGEYPQGRDQLATYSVDDKGEICPDGFCCLGVLGYTDPGIDFRFGIDKSGETNNDHGGYIFVDGNENGNHHVIDWLALPADVAFSMGIDEKIMSHLVAMNDGGIVFAAHSNKIIRRSKNPRSFAFIARFLEIVWPI